jgi:aspartate dehydrogenase
VHLGLIGYGSIAQALIARLPKGQVTEVTVLVRTAAQASQPRIRFVTTRDALLDAEPVLVVECAGHGALHDHAEAILDNGTDLIAASVGAFADDALLTRVRAAADRTGAQLILPTGAIGGLDLLEVLAGDGPVEVRYTGTKPPAAWKGSAAEGMVALDALADAVPFYRGTARAAAADFPKNANVVAALALAGGGFDRMMVDLIADPAATGNTHSYRVTSPACTYAMQIENAPSAGNAATSLTTVLSIRAEIMKRMAQWH